MATALKVPLSRPQMTEAQVHNLLTPEDVDRIIKGGYKVFVVGVRGYYRDTMGSAGANDRGIYDDALFILTPDGFYAFNGNTDPSRQNPGMAVLVPGFYLYKPGIHGVSGPNPYPAFRQYSNVTVLRDGSTVPVTDSPANRFWINMHKGGITTTSSLGCQTVPPVQWVEYRDTLKRALRDYKQKDEVFPYILTTYK